MSVRILVTIAARGGSKGIKGKNIRPLNGLPLIAYTIRQAKRWGKAARIIVSTDSPAIAAVARRHGAEVPFMRPAALATDNAGKVGVIVHALKACEQIYTTRFDVVVDLDATSPVRTVQDLDNCLKLYLRFRPATIFSVVEAHKSPYFNMVEQTSQGKVVLCKALKAPIVRRQDAPAVYEANASIYFYDRNYLLRSRDPKVLNDRCRIYLMPAESGFDIDRDIDLKFLEFLIQKKMVRL